MFAPFLKAESSMRPTPSQTEGPFLSRGEDSASPKPNIETGCFDWKGDNIAR